MSTTTQVFHTHIRHYRADYQQLLPDSEAKRLKQMHSQQRRCLFILGRALLMHSLQFLRGEATFSLRYNAQGKPLLTYPNDWFFNLTHSGDELWLTLRQCHPIGIDSEIVHPRSYQRLAKKLFSATAQQAITDAKDPLEMFYRYWTCYEAQVKYLGLSVFSDLPEAPKRHLVSFTHQSQVFSLCSDTAFDAITCYDFSPDEGFLPIAPILLI